MTTTAAEARPATLPVTEAAGQGEPDDTGLSQRPRGLETDAGPTPSLIRLSMVSAVLVVAGLCFARPDIVVLAMPFTITLFLAIARRKGKAVSYQLVVDRRHTVEGARLQGVLYVRTTGDLDLVLLTVGTGEGIAVAGEARTRAFAATAGEEVVIDLGLEAVRWGRTAIGPIALTAWSGSYAFVLPTVGEPRWPIAVLPRIEPFRADASLPYPVATAGAHRSQLRGDGLDFAGIRPFVFGDRLRRVNWRVSRRLGSLHVVEALTERSAEIVVLVDSGQDVGESGGIHGAPSSLDSAVRAAAAITSHYLRRGDTVRLVDVGTHLRFLRPLSGYHGIVVASDFLLDTRLAEAGEAWHPHRVAQLLPPRSIVLALTPLLDERMTTLVARLRQRGQPVVVVDTLPPTALPTRMDTYERLGLRMWMLERQDTIALLTENGCPVVPWGSGSLDAVLRALVQAETAPKVPAK